MNIGTLVDRVKKQRNISILSFSLFFAWTLSFPFEGHILYSLAENAGIDGSFLSLLAIFAHFIGLITSGFFIKRQSAAKMTMIIVALVSISGSLIFFLPFSLLWYISIFAISFFSGLCVASWGFYYKTYSNPAERIKIAADVLILSNIIMIFTNVLTVSTSVFIGLGLSIIWLLGALLATFRLETSSDTEDSKKTCYTKSSISSTAIFRPLGFLSVFILIITINSGLMYQVVTPTFAHYKLLINYYWAVPYILALLLLRNLPEKVNRAYILYVAMIMIGLSFISFMWLDKSVTSYLIVNTLMLGAFGVCDLFWWSILGNMFDYYHNPAQILGMGLSMNVLGILVGGFIGNYIFALENGLYYASVIALVVIFVVMIMLPILNNQLTRLLEDHPFIIKFANMVENDPEKDLMKFRDKYSLTEKETEVVQLLLRGYTYKVISGNLFISENTLKYHIKNIYQKSNVSNKMDLIKLFLDENNNISS